MRTQLNPFKKNLVLLVFLLLAGCSKVIVIELRPTQTPTPIATATPVPTATAQLLDESVLEPGGFPVRIEAQTIELDAPVVEMGWHFEEQWGTLTSVWDMPENEGAWHRNSAWPGTGGNVVISGHNASLGGQIFADIELLEIEDVITVWNERGHEFQYRVREKEIIRTLAATAEGEARLQATMAPTPSEQLTLITCWPRWTNTHRLILVAEPVPPVLSGR